MVSPKKVHWNMIFFVFRKDFFLEKRSYSLDGNGKTIFLKKKTKKTWKYDIFVYM